jgi:hypothetical protein
MHAHQHQANYCIQFNRPPSLLHCSIDRSAAGEEEDMAASVARHHLEQQPTGATSMMARVERLDLVLGYLEEMMQQQHRRTSRSTTTATSSPSTPAATGGGLMMMSDDSSAASTPRGSKSWRRASWCRPAKEALEEAQAKGTLVDRIAFLEDRVLKVHTCSTYYYIIVHLAVTRSRHLIITSS